MTEDLIRRRFQTLTHDLGLPQASEIGQHEIVSNAKMSALGTMADDLAVFLRELQGREGEEALAAFLAFRDGLRTAELRGLSEESFRRRFLR